MTGTKHNQLNDGRVAMLLIPAKKHHEPWCVINESEDRLLEPPLVAGSILCFTMLMF